MGICKSIVYGSGVSSNCSSKNNAASFTFTGLATFESGTFDNCSGLWLAIDGVRLGQPYFFYGDATITIDCGDPSTAYDCLNGGCIPKGAYNTPGKYATLQLCQASCNQGTNCDGECVSAAEISALQQTANLVKSKLCR
jgi:hypothetical protein